MMFSSQCSNYTTINDPTRNINQAGGVQNDLQTFTSGQQWIRFEGPGGTQIPTSAVPSNQCGTYASGWYSGDMPSISGTTVNGTVCYTWTSGSCQYTNQIQVTNCGSYYVYNLRAPPVSGLRYCTDTPAVESKLIYHFKHDSYLCLFLQFNISLHNENANSCERLENFD
jgi:uromodulin